MECLDMAVAMDVTSTVCTPAMVDSSSSSSSKPPSPSDGNSKPEDATESHKCPYKTCGKFFSKKYNLKAHLRLHTGEQPFECPRPDCDKKFKWRSSLSSHSVWHTRKDAGMAVGTAAAAEGSLSRLKNVQLADLRTITANEMCGKSVTNSQAAKKASAPKKKRPRVPRTKTGKSASTSASALTASVVSDAGVYGGAELSSVQQTGGQGATKRRKQGVPHSKTSPMAIPSVIDTIAAALNAAMETGGSTYSGDTDEHQIFDVLPGSPVTSDGDNSEKTLDCELFNGTLLPPLSTITGGGDVDAILGHTSDLFPSPSNGALQGVDTRFGPFELDNLQGFCAGKAEGM